MKRTNPFIIPLTMFLVGIALDGFAGPATLSKQRKASIAQGNCGRVEHLTSLGKSGAGPATLETHHVELSARKSVILYTAT